MSAPIVERPARLVGRAEEIERLTLALDAVAAGDKRGAVLSADAGQGKSALLRLVTALARERGVVVASARTPAGVPLPALFPVGELTQALARGMAAAGRVVPDSLQAALASPEPVSAPHLTAIIEEAGLAGPVAFVIDDYHWTPREGSTLLLSALRAVDAPVGLFVSVRPRDPDVTAATEPPRSSADLAMDTIEPVGLDRAATAELGSAMLGAPLLPSAVEALHDATSGNPLHVIETLRGGLAEGWLTQVEGRFTVGPGFTARSVLESIGARLARLDEPTVTVAGALAVLGRPFDAGSIAAVAGLDDGRTREALAALVTEGLAAGAEGDGGYQLSHALHAEAARAALGPVRCETLHGRAYDMLSAGGGAAASERAHHAIHAGRRPDGLGDLLAEAAQRAQESGSPAQAAEWFQRLAELADDDAQRRDALIGCAEATARFDPTAAADRYAALIDGASGAERAHLLAARATVFQRLGRFEEGLADLEAALPIAAAEDVFAIEDGIAVIHLLTGRREESEARLRRLVAAEAGGPNHARALFHLAAAVAYRGDVEGLIDYSQQGLDVCTDQHLRRSLRNNLVWGLMLHGRWPEAETHLRPAIQESEDSRDYWNLLPIVCNSALLYAWKGDTAQAIDLAVRARTVADRLGNTMDKVKALECMGVALLEAGEASGAVRVFADIREMLDTDEAREIDYTFLVMAEAHLALGDVAGAAEFCDRAESLLASDSLIWAESVGRLRAQILLAGGDCAGALGCLKPWLDRPGPVALENARVLEVAGYATHKAGDRAAGHAMIADASGRYEALGAGRRAGAARAWMVVNGPRPLGRPRSSRPAGLTDREYEILGLIVQGKTNREIAADLVLSPSTVKKHVERILSKAGVSRRAELASFAVRLGIPIGSDSPHIL